MVKEGRERQGEGGRMVKGGGREEGRWRQGEGGRMIKLEWMTELKR